MIMVKEIEHSCVFKCAISAEICKACFFFFISFFICFFDCRNRLWIPFSFKEDVNIQQFLVFLICSYYYNYVFLSLIFVAILYPSYIRPYYLLSIQFHPISLVHFILGRIIFLV